MAKFPDQSAVRRPARLRSIDKVVQTFKRSRYSWAPGHAGTPATAAINQQRVSDAPDKADLSKMSPKITAPRCCRRSDSLRSTATPAKIEAGRDHRYAEQGPGRHRAPDQGRSRGGEAGRRQGAHRPGNYIADLNEGNSGAHPDEQGNREKTRIWATRTSRSTARRSATSTAR